MVDEATFLPYPVSLSWTLPHGYSHQQPEAWCRSKAGAWFSNLPNELEEQAGRGLSSSTSSVVYGPKSTEDFSFLIYNTDSQDRMVPARCGSGPSGPVTSQSRWSPHPSWQVPSSEGSPGQRHRWGAGLQTAQHERWYTTIILATKEREILRQKRHEEKSYKESILTK
jgi:hypothetical protein